ncbi:MAG: right-handed parallel beta-helix repeat-containing protein [Desulfurococcales archaeon]|nr:right-handed parallel beta-helix repeat-containing protein [Desulfurococcales archaeon]
MKYTITIILLIILIQATLLQAQETITTTGDEFLQILQKKSENEPIHIILQDGTYHDEVTIKSNTIIYGIQSPTFYGGIIIDGNNIQLYNVKIDIIPPGSTLAIIIKDSSNIILENITINGGPILVYNSSNIILKNITVNSTRFPGITINNTKNINIQKYNYNGNAEYSMYVCNSENVIIDNNTSIRTCETQDLQEITLETVEPVRETATPSSKPTLPIGESGAQSTQDQRPPTGDDRPGIRGIYGAMLGALVIILALIAALHYRRKVRGE